LLVIGCVAGGERKWSVIQNAQVNSWNRIFLENLVVVHLV
jgi:hypothetical protein